MSDLTVGSTYRFRLNAKKDGATWDLTGATVTLHITTPGGTVTAYSATVTGASSGQAEYVGTGSELDGTGTWQRAWQVVQGSVTQRSLPISFGVQRSHA